MKLKLFGGLVTALLLLVGLASVPAMAANVSIRVEQPASPTAKNEFDVVFVALDILGRTISVECFYKAPGGSFTQFDSTKNLPGGGGSETCRVTNSQISPLGTYDFYARANAEGDIKDSDVVSVVYDNSSPGTPSNYSKEETGECSYRIKFKTADDGKTVRVEIYRSDQTTFSLGNSTRVGEVAIGPNTQGEFNDNVPDCGKTYYYAIRAFSANGMASGPVGDPETVITVDSTSQTVGAIPVGFGTGTGGVGGSILGDTTADDTAGESGESGEGDEDEGVEAGDILGDEDGDGVEDEEEKGGVLNTRIIVALILGAIVLAWYFSRRKGSR